MRVSAIIAAAGQGKRMGENQNKVFLSLEQETVLGLTVQQLDKVEEIKEIIVVVRNDEVDFCQQTLLAKGNLHKPCKVIAGGKERQDSVKAGLAALAHNTDYVLIHDGARPLITLELIKNALTNAEEHGTAVLAVPVKDTIKLVQPTGFVDSTPERAKLRAVQTPQIFSRQLIMDAYLYADQNGIIGTDDASLVEAMGKPVLLVTGSYENIKITTPEDLLLAKEILRRRASQCE